MSNLVKCSNIIIKDDDKLVIDSNKMVDAILAQQKKGFGQRAEQEDADGFICGLDAATVEQLVKDPEQETDCPDAVAEAEASAALIVEEARKEAEDIREQARKNGYDEGCRQAETDNDKILSDRLTALENEYAEKEKKLIKHYEELESALEPELVSTITDVMAKAFNVVLGEQREIIITLVNGVIRNSEMSREFVIRVSEEDYKFLVSNKDMIYGAASSEINIDIVKDQQLAKNQCIIETDAGVFDCSLDIQLENLIREIRLISSVCR